MTENEWLVRKLADAFESCFRRRMEQGKPSLPPHQKRTWSERDKARREMRERCAS